MILPTTITVKFIYNYTEFTSSYMNYMQKKSLFEYAAFKTFPIFEIDCSKASPPKNMTVDANLHIESTVRFPKNTPIYCIVVHDCITSK